MRVIIKLKSTESHHSYVTTKNKKTHPDRLVFTKFDPVVRRHVAYQEAK